MNSGAPSIHMERAEDGPLDVIGQAGQDLLVIVPAEAVQVRVDGVDVPRHFLAFSLGV